MRHDYHFVDNLTSTPAPGVGRMIPLELLVPNPDQPRRSFGDMSDLVSSIKEKGILEPVLVRPTGDKYQIIAGERRFRASVGPWNQASLNLVHKLGFVQTAVQVDEVDGEELVFEVG